MGIELPPELAAMADVTGVRWPEADEDALRAQAEAWRRAARELTALAGDADACAERALAALAGSTAEAARRRWSLLGDSDTGLLAEVVRGATQAADRLDHAAEQVGRAKVEIVRQLVTAASTRDAAVVAADAGHPTALLGVDTVLRAAAHEVGAVTEDLIGAVASPAFGGETATPVADVPVSGDPDGRESAEPVEAIDPAEPGDVSDDASSDVSGSGPDDVVEQDGAPTDAGDAGLSTEDTGPIAITQLPTPPSGQAVPGADAPTPPSGTAFRPLDVAAAGTHLSGLASSPAGAPPVYSPPPGPGMQAGPPPAQTPFGHSWAPQQPYRPPTAYAPGHQGQYGAAPPAYGAPAQPGRVPAGPTRGPAQGPWPTAYPATGYPAPVPPGRPPVAPPPAPPASGAFAGGPPPQQQPQPQPQPQPSAPHPGAAAVAVGAPRQERESIVALFVVHMFPIGHLPVASDKPARQLPVPTGDGECGVARFEPHDHPQSHLVDGEQALAALRHGGRRPAPPPTEVLPPVPSELLDEYEPFGELSEAEWRKRYLVRDGERPEYAWPPRENWPEGGHEPGEPVVLEEGTVLDRFGDANGRVFAEDGTVFARRSLPPSHRQYGYRRYRVVRSVPAWKAISAPWFGQPGGGVRYRTVYSAAELVVLGHLADITFEERA